MGISCILQPHDIAPQTQKKVAQPAARQRPAAARLQPQKPPVQEPAAPPVVEKNWQPLPVRMWPPHWQAMSQSARKGKVAWTYLKLGYDLSGRTLAGEDGAAKSARSVFLRKILGDLRHAQGTHTFWPVCLPEDEADADTGELFWSGLRFLGCRGAVIMGSATATRVLPKGGLKPLMQLRHRGHIVWILRDIDSLVAAPDNYRRMLAFLRNAIGPFLE